MSREIEFRAWHDGGVMLQVGDKHGTRHPLDCCRYASCPMQGKHITLMQYTGLRDRNGVKIFEGDIVEKLEMDSASDEFIEYMNCKDGDLSDELKKLIPMRRSVIDVVTMDRFPVFWLMNESFGYEGERLQLAGDFCVIGNIHQNPELLEKSK